MLRQTHSCEMGNRDSAVGLSFTTDLTPLSVIKVSLQLTLPLAFSGIVDQENLTAQFSPPVPPPPGLSPPGPPPPTPRLATVEFLLVPVWWGSPRGCSLETLTQLLGEGPCQ